MSAKRAAIITVATLFCFVAIVAKFSEGEADNAITAPHDGYSISQYLKKS